MDRAGHQRKLCWRPRWLHHSCRFTRQTRNAPTAPSTQKPTLAVPCPTKVHGSLNFAGGFHAASLLIVRPCLCRPLPGPPSPPCTRSTVPACWRRCCATPSHGCATPRWPRTRCPRPYWPRWSPVRASTRRPRPWRGCLACCATSWSTSCGAKAVKHRPATSAVRAWQSAPTGMAPAHGPVARILGACPSRPTARVSFWPWWRGAARTCPACSAGLS